MNGWIEVPVARQVRVRGWPPDVLASALRNRAVAQVACDLLLADLRDRGWPAVESPSQRSRANPFTGVLTLATKYPDGERKSPDALLPLLVHEHVHVRQWQSGRLRRWWRGLTYVLNPRARALIEIEGAAHAIVVFAHFGGQRAVADRMLEGYILALSGLRWPYLTLHPQVWVAKRLHERVKVLVADLRGPEFRAVPAQ